MAGERGGQCRDLYGSALRLEAEMVGEEHAASGDLCDGEIDEYDAAREDLRAERDMRCRDEQTCDKCRKQNRKIDRGVTHWWIPTRGALVGNTAAALPPERE